MKKLLMLGAILILGTVGYGAKKADIIQDADGNYIADTTLTLRTKGNVVDTTNNAVLVITPMNGTGASNDKLMFHFGSVAPGETTTLKGRFKAEVIKEEKGAEPDATFTTKYGQLTKENIKVGLAEKTGTTDPEIGVSKVSIKDRKVYERGVVPTPEGNPTNNIGTITYTLSNASGIQDSGRAYEGEIISTFTANETAKGNFTDTGVMVVVNVTNVEVK